MKPFDQLTEKQKKQVIKKVLLNNKARLKNEGWNDPVTNTLQTK